MKKIGLIVLIFMFHFNYAYSSNVSAVQNFNANKYAGLWYEIARIENTFQRGCENVRASYTPSKNGLEVVNYCVKNDNEETLNTSASFSSSSNIADFKVKVAWFFSIAYRVIYIDSDYKYALVDSGSHKYLWILAREKIIPKAELQNLLDIAKNNGFDINQLHFTKQQ